MLRFSILSVKTNFSILEANGEKNKRTEGRKTYGSKRNKQSYGEALFKVKNPMRIDRNPKSVLKIDPFKSYFEIE